MQSLLTKIRTTLTPKSHLQPHPRLQTQTQIQIQIQILSDLHLELGPQYTTFTFPQTARHLLLAGDIGRLADYPAYLAFLQAQTARYDTVLLVLGNHEFYGLSYSAGLDAARRLAAEPVLGGKLVLLHRARWDDPGSELTVLGCTLWSAIPERRDAVVEGRVKDCKRIEGWSARRHDEVHAEEVAWLREQVGVLKSEGKERRVLVATHHAPCVEGTSRPEQVGNPWTVAFATELLGGDGREWEGVRVWVFGHTHYSARFVRAGIKIMSNQRGYVLPGGRVERGGEGREKKQDGHEFDAGMVVSV